MDNQCFTNHKKKSVFIQEYLMVFFIMFSFSSLSAQSAYTSHLIQKGETLYSISLKYGIQADSLKKWNHMKNNTVIVGERLKVHQKPNSSEMNGELSGLRGQGAPLKSKALKGNLYCIAIGVSEHYDKNIPTLRYTKNDAKDICKTFKDQEGVLYKQVFTYEITNNPIRDTIIRNINNISFLADTNDVIMVFCSSHAVVDDNNMLCLIPKDFDMLETNNAIVVADFLRTLERAPCPKILALDVCFAEAAAFNIVDAINFLGSNFTRNLAILVGASSNEFSKESSRFDHGIFTQSVLDGCKKGEADSRYDNGAISLPELGAYVSNYVAEASNYSQNATMPINFFGNGVIYVYNPQKYDSLMNFGQATIEK